MPVSIVIDASFVLNLVLPQQLQMQCTQLTQQWIEAGNLLMAPTLLAYEVTSGLTLLGVALRQLPLDKAKQALKQFETLGVELIRPTAALQEQALIDVTIGSDSCIRQFYICVGRHNKRRILTADSKWQELSINHGSHLITTPAHIIISFCGARYNVDINPFAFRPNNPSDNKFGTFGGVFTPTIFTILGAIMYLRLGWVVGNAALSAPSSSSCSRKPSPSPPAWLSPPSPPISRVVPAAFAIISQSLGLEIGGSVGIPCFRAVDIGRSTFLAFSEGWYLPHPFYGCGGDHCVFVVCALPISAPTCDQNSICHHGDHRAVAHFCFHWLFHRSWLYTHSWSAHPVRYVLGNICHFLPRCDRHYGRYQHERQLRAAA